METICVQCDFKNFMETTVVFTTHGEIMDILNKSRDLSQYKRMMREALINVIKYNQSEFDIIYNGDNNKIIYVYSYQLYWITCSCIY